LLMNPELTSV